MRQGRCSIPRTLDASRQAPRDPRARVFVAFLDRWHTQYFGQDASADDHAPIVQARFPLLREYEVRVQVAEAEDAAPLGEPVIWRRGPSTGPQYVPAADLRFRRNDEPCEVSYADRKGKYQRQKGLTLPRL
jgi:hypothetical protein